MHIGLGSVWGDINAAADAIFYAPGRAVWWLTGGAEPQPLPETPKYGILMTPAAPVTPTAMESWTPEMAAEVQAQQLGTSAEYEAYLRSVAATNKAIEAAAPSGTPAVPPVEEKFPWTTVLLVGGAFVGGLLLMGKRR